MTFKFHCTCGQKVSATEDMIGTTAVCPRCSSKITVPPPETAESAPATTAVAPPEPAPQAPSPQPAPARETKPAAASLSLPKPQRRSTFSGPAPLSVVSRPMGMLCLATFLALVAALGAGGYLFRSFLSRVPTNPAPLVIGTLATIAGSLVIALFLKLAVRVVARLNLAFSEAWLVTVFTLALNALAATPAALTHLGLWKVEQGAKILPITGGVSLLLTIIAYSFLIWNAVGRPIGVWRGVLTYLLQVIFLGILGGIAYAVMLVYSPKIPSEDSSEAPARTPVSEEQKAPQVTPAPPATPIPTTTPAPPAAPTTPGETEPKREN